MNNRKKRFSIFAVMACCCCAVVSDSTAQAVAEEESQTIWEQTLLSWIEPNFHLTAAVGDSSGDPEELAVGHHDPTKEDGTIQGLEVGASLFVNEYLQGFANYLLTYGGEEEWEGEWEEGFIKLVAPDLGEIRGGRMLSRFGDLNAKHQHAWDLVDLPLVYGRFLGDDGLILDGFDVTAFINPSQTITMALTVGAGERPSHDHAHEDEHEEQGEEEEHDEDHAHEDEHSHDHAALAEDDVFTARAMVRLTPNDFWHWTAGASMAGGQTAEGDDSNVYGIDLSMVWRENGYQAGGQTLRWTTELLYRDLEMSSHGHDDDDHEDEDHAEDHGEDHEDEDHTDMDESTWGLYSSLIYSPLDSIDAGVRVGWVDESEGMEEDERLRISPVLTYYLDSARSTHLRVQYNYDDLDETEEHSVWLQFAASFGGREVR